jgi:hypothetical protein
MDRFLFKLFYNVSKNNFCFLKHGLLLQNDFLGILSCDTFPVAPSLFNGN